MLCVAYRKSSNNGSGVKFRRLLLTPSLWSSLKRPYCTGSYLVVSKYFRHCVKRLQLLHIMASRGGYRPEGSDGSDHWHRESIAWQYKISSINKGRLRLALFLHILLGLLMFARLLPGITGALGMTVVSLRRLDLPHPRPWEYAWLASLMAAVLGWRSIPQNNMFLLKQFILGVVVFGVMPTSFGFFDLRKDISLYLQERKFTFEMFGFPAVLLWGAFLLIAIQIHIFSLYFSYVLLKAWKPRPVEKAKVR